MDTHQLEDYSSCWPTTPYSSLDVTLADLRRVEEAEEAEADGQPKAWQLKLPINGTIAKRRALKRGEDPADIEREQYSRFWHEHECRFGLLKDVDVTFRPVDWDSESRLGRRMERIDHGEPVSPKSKPRVEQMKPHEFEDAFGARKRKRSPSEP